MKMQTDIISLGNELHHCASIALVPAGFGFDYAITFYYGKECTDDQRVVVCFMNKDGSVGSKIYLEHKTGNPVLFNYGNKLFLLYSVFTDATEDGIPIDYGRRPVRRWMNCDNYIAEIIKANEGFELSNINKIDGAYGRLARISPSLVATTKEGNKLLIPMYREEDPICEIWTFDGEKVEKLSEFGLPQDDLSYAQGSLGEGYAIQPTLFHHKGSIHALCRNVTRDHENAFYFNSQDGGATWSKASLAQIPNHNNSISSVNHNDDVYFVYNLERSRNSMVLSSINSNMRMPIHRPMPTPRVSYSYPNMISCGDALHVVHSNCSKIVWHRFDKDFLDECFPKIAPTA